MKRITPALSVNTETSQGEASFCVVPRMKVRNRERIVRVPPFASVYSMSPLKTLWWQCSDQLWASASSSTSVGRGPRPCCRRSSCRAGSR